jgi:hypothetical protein
MIAVAFAADLVEEAVLLAEPSMTVETRRAFRRERDRVYVVSDVDAREVRFRHLHRQWFHKLGLDCGIEQMIADRLTDACGASFPKECRVVGAVTRREEGADLVDRIAPESGAIHVVLVIRLRPLTLLDPKVVAALLHHELTHVADMLDPEFGYERALPPSGEGPSADTILRDRYRVLWDTTIDGRLAREGHADEAVRRARRQEFVDTFTMLGGRGVTAFDEWFACTQPSHARLAAYALSPA